MIRHPKDKAESKYNPDAGISKEDEERYQKLVTENDDLQKLISQVSFCFLYYGSFERSVSSINSTILPVFRKRKRFECSVNGWWNVAINQTRLQRQDRAR